MSRFKRLRSALLSITSSGLRSLSRFSDVPGGISKAVGQQEWRTPGTFNFVVPAGVTSISFVGVGGGGAATPRNYSSGGTSTIDGGITKITRQSDGTVLASAHGGEGGHGGLGGNGGIKQGGGRGGNAGPNRSGAGAAGYSGDGGDGTTAPFTDADGEAGTGGGAGSGFYDFNQALGPGGGVDLYGEGPSGNGGTSGSKAGKGGSDGADGDINLYGGAGGPLGGGAGSADVSSPRSGAGAELSWYNDIAVTPGETLVIEVGGGGIYSTGSNTGQTVGGDGGARVIWPGQLRQFPSERTADEPTVLV